MIYNKRSATGLFLGFSLLLPGAAISDHHEFSIAILPDTQTYTTLRPGIMEAQIDWITANRVTENIIYVGHLGDLKDVGACTNGTIAWPSLANPSTEWDIVRDAFDELDTAGIPYGVTPGNHDFDQRNGVFPADSGGCPNYDGQRPLVGYNNEFPPSSFPVTNYGSRLPGDNEDNFTIASSNGVDFLFINVGYQQEAPAAGSTAVIDWAETLMTTYPNHITIVTSHFLVDCNDSTTGGGSGANGSCAGTPDNILSTYADNIFTRLRAYPNLFMMIGGHRFGEAYIRLDRSTEGFNPVHAVLANYQHLQYSSSNFDTVPIPGPAGGSSGYFKLMEFDMDSMTVDMVSLSPALAANPGISGGPGIFPVLSNGNRPTPVFSTRDVDPSVPTDLVDGGGNPRLHTQSVSNLVNISFAGYVSGGGGSPVTLAFEGNPAPAAGEITWAAVGSDTYSEGGFDIVADEAGQAFYMDVDNKPASTRLLNPTGDYIFYQNNTRLFTLTNASGGAFSLVSFDSAGMFTQSSAEITVTGQLVGGGSVTRVISLPNLDDIGNAFQTYTFDSSWSNLSSVEVDRTIDNFVGFDNIVVVPE